MPISLIHTPRASQPPSRISLVRCNDIFFVLRFQAFALTVRRRITPTATLYLTNTMPVEAICYHVLEREQPLLRQSLHHRCRQLRFTLES